MGIITSSIVYPQISQISAESRFCEALSICEICVICGCASSVNAYGNRQ
jgi:hypothetical protein